MHRGQWFQPQKTFPAKRTGIVMGQVFPAMQARARKNNVRQTGTRCFYDFFHMLAEHALLL